MLFLSTALAAVGLKVVSHYAQWHASPAAVAIWPVSEQTAASKAFGYQF
jgi:hypothetical protein